MVVFCLCSLSEVLAVQNCAQPRDPHDLMLYHQCFQNQSTQYRAQRRGKIEYLQREIWIKLFDLVMDPVFETTTAHVLVKHLC